MTMQERSVAGHSVTVKSNEAVPFDSFSDLYGPNVTMKMMSSSALNKVKQLMRTSGEDDE